MSSVDQYAADINYICDSDVMIEAGSGEKFDILRSDQIRREEAALR